MLAVTRCLRQDLIQSSLHNLIALVYDFGYLNFMVDFVSRHIDVEQTLKMRRFKIATSASPTSKMNAEFKHPSRKPIDNNIQSLIAEAFKDSTAFNPIFFFVSHSINVYQ